MSSNYVDLEDLDKAAQQIPADKPVIMLNLLKFRHKALYPSDSSFPSCSGQEAYGRYRDAFGKVVKPLGIPVVPVYVGQAHTNLMLGGADASKWDMIALVKYPSFEDFRRVVESKDYLQNVKMHRLAALEDIVLLCTTELS